MGELRETSGIAVAPQMIADRLIAFDAFRFRARTGELWHGEREVKLTPRAAAVLAQLAEHAQQVVTKQRLFAAVWNRRAVTDEALTSCIQELRRALGDDARRTRYIETRHRRGYRLMMPVTVLGPGPHGQQMLSGVVPAVAADPVPTLPDKPSLAVLPFQNIGSDPDQEYFADGLVEDITTALSRVGSFFVIARNSSFTYKGRPVQVRQVGRELGVRYVIEGSVRRSGRKLRLSAQLVEADSGRHIWAERYDGDLQDVFDLQDRVVEAIVGAINPSVRSAEVERARLKRPDSLRAYDYVLRAYPLFWSMDKGALPRAIELFAKALELDPGYALASAMAAWCHAALVSRFQAGDIEGRRREGLRLASAALESSRDDPNVLFAAGTAIMYLGTDADLDRCLHLFHRALSLDRNSASGWRRLGLLHVNRSEPDEAIAAFERALRLSPLDPMQAFALQGIAIAHFIAGRFSIAVDAMRPALAERPQDPPFRRLRCAFLAKAGRIAEAEAIAHGLLIDDPGLSLSRIKSTSRLRPAALKMIQDGLRAAGIPE